MKPLTREEYSEIYRTTGIDIDGRQEKAKTILPAVKKSITNMVKFARHIPGFTELSIEDQHELVEGMNLLNYRVVREMVTCNVNAME